MIEINMSKMNGINNTTGKVFRDLAKKIERISLSCPLGNDTKEIIIEDEYCAWRSLMAMPNVRKVLHQDIATIVFFNDGTKEVVKCQNEEYDKEKATSVAIAKRMVGGYTKLKEITDKAIDVNVTKEKGEINND